MYAPVLLHACARVWLVRVCACGGGTAPRRDGLVMGYPLLTVAVPTILSGQRWRAQSPVSSVQIRAQTDRQRGEMRDGALAGSRYWYC